LLVLYVGTLNLGFFGTDCFLLEKMSLTNCFTAIEIQPQFHLLLLQGIKVNKMQALVGVQLILLNVPNGDLMLEMESKQTPKLVECPS
jgi:hypothetical protein